jgi:uroporphyrinogen-III synthase
LYHQPNRMAAPRILVTRAAHQASELATGLRAAGMEPIVVPTIEIAPPRDEATLRDALADLSSFDWLVFTSANAVDAFTAHRHASHPHDLKIAAIGPATARALTAAGLPPDLVPPQAVAESLAEALLPHALQPDGSPSRFLLIRAEQARDHLHDILRAAGAEVTIAPAYRNIVPSGAAMALRELFSRPPFYPDAVTFTSSSTAQHLLDLLKAEGLTLPPQVIRASIGPVTSQTLREAGLPPQVEAASATIPALVEALRKALAERA